MNFSRSRRRIDIEELEPRRLLAYDLVQTLLPPDPSGPHANSEMGHSVSISDQYRAVGIPRATFSEPTINDVSAGLVTIYDSNDQLIASIENPDPEVTARFGTVVALSDTDKLVVGSAGFDRVFVYDLQSGTPELLHDLTGFAPDDGFGVSLAIDGDTVISGADAGEAAYVFDVGQSAAMLTHTLVNPTPESFDSFGTAVAIDDNTVVVSATRVDLSATVRNVGEVFVFDISAATPSLTHTIVDSTPEANAEFGEVLVVDGTTVVVGVPNAGIVDVFDIGTPTPQLRFTLENPEPNFRDDFGRAIAHASGLLLVGSPGDEVGGRSNAGSVYQFSLTEFEATLVGAIENPTLSSGDFFGWSVAINNDGILVGGLRDTSGVINLAGAVHSYQRSGLVTTFSATLENPTLATGDRFGSSVSIDGDVLVVGVPGQDLTFANEGEALVYDLSDPSMPPDLPVTLFDPMSSGSLGNVVAHGDGIVVVTSETSFNRVGSLLVFDITGAAPSLVHRIPAPPSDEFGANIVMSGSMLAVAAPGRGFTGSIYVYDLSSFDPTVPFVIDNPTTNTFADDFGLVMAIDESTLVVGSPFEGDDGMVLIYDLRNTPRLRETLVHPDPQDFSEFGLALAIDGSTVVVSEESTPTSPLEFSRTQVYVYDYNSSNSTATMTHTIDRPQSSLLRFGESLVVSGDDVFVGAPSALDTATDVRAGVISVFDIGGPTAIVKDFIENPSPAEDERFGEVMSVDNGTLVVGVATDGEQNLGQGAVYLFRENFVGDFDSDGDLACSDINAMTTAIINQSADMQFDLNGDGLIDLLDRDEWLSIAGSANLGLGSRYQLGDANLNGSVDATDFNIWISNRFSETTNWCSGDFDTDGAVDVADFNIWNSNRFSSADTAGHTNSIGRDAGQVYLAFSPVNSIDDNDDQHDDDLRTRETSVDFVFAEFDVPQQQYSVPPLGSATFRG